MKFLTNFDLTMNMTMTNILLNIHANSIKYRSTLIQLNIHYNRVYARKSY